MSKMCLCVKASEYLNDPTLENLLSLQPYLVERSLADDPVNVDSVNLQIISYVTIVNEAGEIFAYLRGKGGTESRLHDLYSIGVGGHVDTTPDFLTGLLQLLVVETSREIEEEVGIVPDQSRIEAGFNTGELVLLYDPQTDREKVHLGLNFVYRCDGTELAAMEFEENQVLEPQWLSLAQLREKTLEPWSKMVVDRLTSQLTKI